MDVISTPEFYDIFGIVIFLFIVIVAINGLRGKKLPRWTYGILLFIGIAGLIIDGAIVFNAFLR